MDSATLNPAANSGVLRMDVNYFPNTLTENMNKYERCLYLLRITGWESGEGGACVCVSLVSQVLNCTGDRPRLTQETEH